MNDEMSAIPAPDNEPLEMDAPFEQVVARLEQVVAQLEEGDLPLERSLSIYEEGVGLYRLGTRRLDDAEERVEALLADGLSAQTRPLDEKEHGTS